VEKEQSTTEERSEQERRNWHGSFLEALKVDLEDFSDVLQIQEEFHLSEQALRIDALIIRKMGGRKILSTIAAYFLGWNVVEYKGPDTSFSVKDLHKVLGYAHFLAANKGAVWEDTTVTIIRTGKSRAVLEYLKGKKGVQAKESKRVNGEETGIWVIRGYGDIRIQIVQSEKLPEGEHRWLRNLREGLPKKTLLDIVDMDERQKEKLGTYIQTVVAANFDRLEEVLDMTGGDMLIKQALDKTGWTERLTREVRQEAEEVQRRMVEEAKRERQKAEQERQKAEQERQKAEQERQKAVQYLTGLGLQAEQIAEALGLSVLEVCRIREEK